MDVIDLINERRYDEALEIVNGMIKKGNEKAYLLSAEIYYRMYLDTGYDSYLKKAAERLEKVKGNEEKLFSIYLMLGEYGKCREIINKADGELKKFLNALLAFEEKGDASKLKSLVNASTSISDAYLVYSRILYQEGRYEMARDVLKRGFKITKDREIKNELKLVESLLNAEKPIILKCTFKNSQLVSKELIHCKSIYEFIDMIGISYEGESISLLVPYSKSLFLKIKDRIPSIFKDDVSLTDVERMLELCEKEVEG